MSRTPDARLLRCLLLNADFDEHISSNLDAPGLVALSQCDSVGRSIARMELKQRFRVAAEDFLPNHAFPSFVKLLDDTDGAVGGSFPSVVMNLGAPIDRNLCATVGFMGWGSQKDQEYCGLPLFMPLVKWGVTQEWLHETGFSEAVDEPIPPAYRAVVSRVTYAEHPSKKKSGPQRRGIRIFITEEPLSKVALSAPWSCDTGLLTASTLVIFFPTLHFPCGVMRNPSETSGLATPFWHWLCCAEQAMSVAACGPRCPAATVNQPRPTKPLLFHWKESIAPISILFDDDIREHVSRYRARCYNELCANYTNPTRAC